MAMAACWDAGCRFFSNLMRHVYTPSPNALLNTSDFTTPAGWPPSLILESGHGLAEDWLRRCFREKDTAILDLGQVEKFIVREVAHYKQVFRPSQHEFGIVTLVNGSRQGGLAHELLYMSYERNNGVPGADPETLYVARMCRILGKILAGEPIWAKDHITMCSSEKYGEIQQQVEDKDVVVLRKMTFASGAEPTILDVAAVLEAHSQHSRRYLRRTMCYWYASSPYCVIEHMFKGRSVETAHMRKAGKYRGFPAYRRDIPTQDMDGLMDGIEVHQRQLVDVGAYPSLPEEGEGLALLEEAPPAKIPDINRVCRDAARLRNGALKALRERENERAEIACLVTDVTEQEETIQMVVLNGPGTKLADTQDLIELVESSSGSSRRMMTPDSDESQANREEWIV